VGRGEEPAENRKERRLSRTIRSDHADDLSGSNLKRHPGKSLQSPEGPGKVLHSKQQRLEGSRMIVQRIIHELTFLWPASASSRQSGIGGVKGHNMNEISFPGSPACGRGASQVQGLKIASIWGAFLSIFVPTEVEQ
jgi:hypothetical protein